MAAGLRSGLAQNPPCMLKQLHRRAHSREGERMMRRDAERCPGSTAHRCACTYTRHVALVAPTLETRVSFYFLLRTRGGRIFLEFVSGRLSGFAKGPDPPESSSTSRIPPLRSARLRATSFSFFNVGKQSQGEVSRSIDGDRAVRGSFTIAARSTVRDDESVFPPKSGYWGQAKRFK